MSAEKVSPARNSTSINGSLPTVRSVAAPATARDRAGRKLEREIKSVDEIFHNDKLIGGTIGVACAMQRPNAANRRPETYPKFQVQLRRVAPLRDLINWRIEQPARGKRLDPGYTKMPALEAYINVSAQERADGIRQTLKILSG